MLHEARDAGRTIQDLITEFTAAVTVDIESALLLRDIWEVLSTTQSRAADHSRSLSDTLQTLVARMGDHPITAGEEVLF